MKINRKELVSKLESLKPGLVAKSNTPQSDYFLFLNDSIYTFNDESCCRIPSPFTEIETAVPAKKILEILGKMSEDEVDLELESDGLHIFGDDKEATIFVDNNIEAPLSSVDVPDEWSELPEDFIQAVNTVQQCCSTNESWFVLNCVHIHPEWIEACDNAQICRWPSLTGFETSVLIRNPVVKNIPKGKYTHFAEGKNWIHFKNEEGLIFSCRRYSEEYFDCSDFLTVENKGESLEFPEGLDRAVDNASLFSVDQTGEDNKILIEMGKNKIKIMGEGMSGWYKQKIKCNYKSDVFSFLISPELLKDIAKKHQNCSLYNNKIIVNGEKYIYVALLGRPKIQE